ncbi:MAG TPA: CYTH and CHAD domain-containing protein [Acetobacteraceae bacterium]|nr:CYTH and CHAD domain-containing protein [Acetobacteraceae bacterium]
MPTKGDPHRELELKLAVPQGAAGSVLDHPALLLAGPDARRQHQVTTYYDTADHTLAQAGIALRVRCNDGVHVRTVKADRDAGLAADRSEWEWPIERNRPDPNLLAQTPVGARLPQPLALEPVAVTEIDRTTRLLDLDDGTQVEAAFDAGWIIAGNARAAVQELELELRHGDAAAMYRLALHLHATVAVTVETEAKSARGIGLRNGTAPEPRKACSVALTAGTHGAEACRRIMAAGLDHLLANRGPTLAGNAKGLHQMRVAIRRLRAALEFFKPHLEPHARARFEAELRRIGRVFGEARDWDVFCLHILPETLAGADRAAGWGEMLKSPAQRRRDAAFRTVTEEVAAPAFTALVLGLAAWVEQGCGKAPLPGGQALDQPVAKLCPALLDRLADKVEHRGRHIESGSDTERHGLRKSVKKLRYAIDYVAEAYPHKPVKSYLHACEQLQESLGEINDAVAATGLAERLADGHSDLTPALGALASILGARRQDALRDLSKRWRHFRSEQRFWT